VILGGRGSPLSLTDLCCSRNLITSHSDYYTINLIVIPILTRKHLSNLGKNSASYARFLFEAIFISEFSGGSRYLKKTIIQLEISFLVSELINYFE